MAHVYSLIRNSDDAILEHSRNFEDSTPQDPRTLTQKFGPTFSSRWVAYVNDPIPTPGVDYDPAIEKIVQGDLVVPNGHHTTYTVTALTQAELDAIADTADRQAKGDNITPAMINTLRTWATQAGNTTVTQGNAVNTLQTMVNRMGTFFSRFADLIESRRYDQGAE